MIILDFDEFNIYTNREDVENFIESTISNGIDSDEKIYTLCLEHFGESFREIINEIFEE
jgi:hypothetical protein